MKNDEVGFAIVGLGIGRSRSRFCVDTPGANLVAVCDLDEERGRQAAGEFDTTWYPDYRRALDRDDVDVVLVMTPSGSHASIGVEVAKAGKAVVTTKPIDVRLEAIDALIAECEKQGVLLATDFNFRYLANNVRIRECLDRGSFGKLILGEARLKWFRDDNYFAGWRGTWEHDGGGSLMNQGVHQVDLLQWFMGDVESVRGVTGVFAHRDLETEDLAAAMLRFRNGALGTILTTTTFPEKGLQPVVEIHGDRGAASTARGNLLVWNVPDEGGADDWEYAGPTNIIEDILGVLRDGKQPFVTGREARKSVELVLAVYESARTGREVTMPLTEYGPLGKTN